MALLPSQARSAVVGMHRAIVAEIKSLEEAVVELEKDNDALRAEKAKLEKSHFITMSALYHVIDVYCCEQFFSIAESRRAIIANEVSLLKPTANLTSYQIAAWASATATNNSFLGQIDGLVADVKTLHEEFEKKHLTHYQFV